MFGKSTEKRVLREADKIVSLKEDMDALSWGRVLEIGKLLEGADGDDRVEYAHELVSIAQSNLSLCSRLGIDPAPAAPPRVMASGIEVLEGGLADAALEKAAEPAERVIAVPPIPVPVPAAEPSETDFEAAAVRHELELVAENDPDEADFEEASKALVAEEPEPEAPAPQDERSERRRPEPAPRDVILSERSESKDPERCQPEPAPGPEPEAPEPSPEPEVAILPESEPMSEPQPVPEPAPAPHPAPAKPAKRRFARFRHLYESRDGGLCVFEDEHGHLVAVDASKLA